MVAEPQRQYHHVSERCVVPAALAFYPGGLVPSEDLKPDTCPPRRPEDANNAIRADRIHPSRELPHIKNEDVGERS